MGHVPNKGKGPGEPVFGGQVLEHSKDLPLHFLRAGCGCFQKYWYPKMDGLKWMIWGYHGIPLFLETPMWVGSALSLSWLASVVRCLCSVVVVFAVVVGGGGGAAAAAAIGGAVGGAIVLVWPCDIQTWSNKECSSIIEKQYIYIYIDIMAPKYV